MVPDILHDIDSYAREARQWREHLHRHPELSFKEFQTAAFIREKLQSFGVDQITPIAETGTIALVKGQNPELKCIGFRADIDALPIQEENDVPYKSQHEGVMHACGHDVHTSILLGFTQWLCEHRDQFEGTVKLLFQPGEELLPGGARLLIEKGALKNPKVERLYGLHVFPDLEVGKVGFRPGMYMASCDELHITVTGKGGHAAMPERLVDPVLMATQLVNDLQKINSRFCPPSIPSVLSIGKIVANGATNIIPDQVHLEGTFRTMNENWRAQAHQHMTNISNGITQQFGGKIEFEIRKGYPYLENHPATTITAKSNVENMLGSENVVELPIRMTAEDFAHYTHHVPCCFFRLGTRNESKNITSGVHQSTFDIDPEAIALGITSFISLLKDL